MSRATCKLVVRITWICFCCLTEWSQACCVSDILLRGAVRHCCVRECGAPIGRSLRELRGGKGLGGVLCMGTSPLGSCSCFWGCWRVVPAPLWVREAHAPGLWVPSALHIGCIYLQWELAVWVTGGDSGVSRCGLLSYGEHQPSH